MITKFSSKCSVCGQIIPKGTEVQYDYKAKTISHYDCSISEQAVEQEPADQFAERLGFVRWSDIDRVRWTL